MYSSNKSRYISHLLVLFPCCVHIWHNILLLLIELLHLSISCTSALSLCSSLYSILQFFTFNTTPLSHSIFSIPKELIMTVVPHFLFTPLSMLHCANVWNAAPALFLYLFHHRRSQVNQWFSCTVQFGWLVIWSAVHSRNWMQIGWLFCRTYLCVVSCIILMIYTVNLRSHGSASIWVYCSLLDLISQFRIILLLWIRIILNSSAIGYPSEIINIYSP